MVGGVKKMPNKIESCWQCPAHERLIHSLGTVSLHCHKKHRDINIKGGFPDWCPLEDVEDIDAV